LQRGVEFLEIPHLVFQISARAPKRLGCISLRTRQSNNKEARYPEQGNARQILKRKMERMDRS
jgi:hypothetical protein